MINKAQTIRLLAGSGRSGTTWLLDVLCNANQLRPVFEPLHPATWRSAVPFAHKYAGPSENWPELEHFWSAVLRHQCPKVWADFRTRPDRLVPALASFSSVTSFKRFVAHWQKLVRNRRIYGPRMRRPESLIKVIRANLMVPWLATVLQAKVAFVIRHPASVVESQLRIGRDWNAAIIARAYAGDRRLDQRLGVEWGALIGNARSDAELFTLIWCLENLLPLQDCAALDNVTFVFYEDLVLQDSAAWGSLLRSLDLSHMPDAGQLQAPSQQASDDLRREKIEMTQLANSLERLKPSDRDDIQRVLDRLQISLYHTSEIRPNPLAMETSRSENWSGYLSRSA